MGTRLALKIKDADVIPGKHAFKEDVGAEEKLFNAMKKYAF